MRCSTLDERFRVFIEEPTSDHYQTVRELILNRPDYDPYDTQFHVALRLFHADEYQRVLELCKPLDAAWRLSPRYHFVTGVSLQQMGDPPGARRRRELSQACLHALLQTGDGSADAPFLVTYLTDAYDLMTALELHPAGQRLVEVGDQRLDVITTRTESEYFFDVTALLRRHFRLADGQQPLTLPGCLGWS